MNVRKKQGIGLNKEICDLMVIFGDSVIIFSSKKSSFQTDTSKDVAWQRWYRKTISKSVSQLEGAERWIKQYPEEIYLDKQCTVHLPQDIDISRKRVFKIAIAEGASAEAMSHFGSYTGLFFDSTLSPEENILVDNIFKVGNPGKNGFIHVFDENTIIKIFQELDTVKDFIGYLRFKEGFIASRQFVIAGAEEDILSIYLKKIYFGMDMLGNDDHKSGVVIGEFEWEAYRKKYKPRISDIRERSKVWDLLITRVTEDVIRRDTTPIVSIAEAENALKYMAGLDRIERFTISQSLKDIIEKPKEKGHWASRWQIIDNHEAHALETSASFLLFSYNPEVNETREEIRIFRIAKLHQHIVAAKARYPWLKHVVGLAFNSNFPINNEFDLYYINISGNDDDIKEEGLEYIRNGDVFVNSVKVDARKLKNHYLHSEIIDHFIGKRLTGRDRNKLCPCGSGKKYKRCHGLNAPT